MGIWSFTFGPAWAINVSQSQCKIKDYKDDKHILPKQKYSVLNIVIRIIKEVLNFLK